MTKLLYISYNPSSEVEGELAKFDRLQKFGGAVRQRPTKRRPLGMKEGE